MPNVESKKMTNHCAELVAIVVTYHPNAESLRRLVEAIHNQVLHVLVVDNGSTIDSLNWLSAYPGVELIALGKNLGIAAAQNRGIQRAREVSAEAVVLFDQDSDPGRGLLPVLYASMRDLKESGKAVACVGPRYFDARQNEPAPFIRIEGCRLKRLQCGAGVDVIPVDHLIASGSLIPVDTLNAVGDMAEALFIDYVDLEWCERALKHGYQSYGVCSVTMAHALGDDPITFMGRPRPARSPLRHYYMMRNAVWMYRQPWPRFGWKVADALRLVRKYVFYSLFAQHRMTHIKMMSQGLWDGFTNRMGPYRGK